LAFKVGLVSRLDEPKALEVARNLARQLRRKGVTVIAEAELARSVDSVGVDTSENSKQIWSSQLGATERS